VVRAFTTAFPEHEVVRLSSACSLSHSCSLEAEISEYALADVLVGLHGAGLTNQMFMRPGSLVVELQGDYSDVSSPGVGYYGTMAAISGHHHCLYAFVDPCLHQENVNAEYRRHPLRPKRVAAQARLMYQAVHRSQELPAVHVKMKSELHNRT
jgi:hypothetical protein